MIYLWGKETNDCRVIYGDENVSIRSLKFSHQRLYFLQNKVGGSHFKASQLCSLDGGINTFTDFKIHDKEIFAEFIEEVDGEIFVNQLKDGKRALSTIHEEGEALVSRIIDSQGSRTLLDAKKDILLLKESSPISFPKLLLRDEISESYIDASDLVYRENLADPFKEFEYSIHDIDAKSNFILIKPPISNNGLILIPHGGPNSIATTDFDFGRAYLALKGYTVAIVNYTGSIGFSSEAIEELEGTIGEKDTGDVIKVMRIIKEDFKLSFTRTFLMGGSHGGYIAAFLSGQFPEMFTGCALLNPVIDLAFMTMASDIDDWSFGQMGFQNDLHRPMPYTEEQLIKFYRHSPASVLGSVVAPTIVLVGEKDLRVPNYQGKQWHCWLKAKDVKTELYSFPEANHSLFLGNSEKPVLQAITDFFESL